jgi:hypothetical protein
MRLCLRILVVAIIAATSLSLTGCAGPAGFSYQNVTVTLTPFCTDCPQGIFYNPAYPLPTYVTPTSNPAAAGSPSPPGSVLYMFNQGEGGTDWFQADVTNAPPNITWAVYPTPDLGDITLLPSGTGAIEGGAAGNNFYNYGSFVSASGNIAYFAQSGIPTYTGGPALQQAIAMGIPQGDVMLTASVPSNPSNPSQTVTASQLIQMCVNQGNPSVQMFPKTPTNPSQTTSVATVPRGTSFQFTGYAVGATPCSAAAACNAIYPGAPLNTADNTVVWLVGNANATFGGVGNLAVGGLVNGVPGPYGTITQTGLYTAPAVIPPSGYNPLIVMESHFAPTVQALAYITIN